MATQVTFHKRVPQGSRGSLAELMARQAEAAKAASSAQDIQTPTIMQGLGKLGQIGANVFKEKRAEKAGVASREALAKLIAGIGEGGATQQQVADMGLYDQDLAEQYRQEAVAARAAAAERANKLADMKEERIYSDLREGRIDQREAAQAKAIVDAERAHEATVDTREQGQTIAAEGRAAGREERIDTREQGQTIAAEGRAAGREEVIDTREQGQTIAAEGRQAAAAKAVTVDERDYQGGIDIRNRNQALADDRTQFLRDQAETIRKEKQEAAATAAKPSGPLGEFMSDRQKFEIGVFGDPNDPLVRKAFEERSAKETAISKGMTVYDANGNPIVTTGGATPGAGEKPKLDAQALDTYRGNAQASNDLLPTLQNMDMALGAIEQMGPVADWYDAADRFLESIPYTGDKVSLPGQTAASALFKSGGLDMIFKAIQNTKGSISNAENILFAGANPQLTQTKEGARVLIGIAKAKAQRDLQRDAEAQQWYTSHTDPLGRNTLEGFEQHWNEVLDNNPIIGFDPKTMQVRLATPEDVELARKRRRENPQVPLTGDPNAVALGAPAAAPAAAPVAPAAPAQGAADVDAILQQLDAEEAAPPPPVVAPGLRERLERQRAGSMGRR